MTISVTRSDEIFANVEGVRFLTTARQGTAEEDKLQEIQSHLAKGKVLVGSEEPIPQLALVEQVNGPTVISLWVPKPKEEEAVAHLQSSGFELRWLS